MTARLIAVLMLLATSAVARSPEKDSRATEPDFLRLYKELVETNTTLSAGSCTLAAERMVSRLQQAGFAENELHLFADPKHPKEGGLVAIDPGKDARRKAILLLAHLDVVEAKREDWTRDPFTLTEEDGTFYARGAFDDKSEAAIWVDTLIRFRREGFKPRRTVKLALTCGEETAGAFNGADWLLRNQRDLIDAEFALNEGAIGEMDAHGKRLVLEVQAGEKYPQNYQLEVTNEGGHSSRPVKDNAIYHLAEALSRIDKYEFPVQFNDVNRAYFAGISRVQAALGNQAAADAMRAFVANPRDANAIDLVANSDPSWNATLRTTCVATMVDGGHATNALPQRARANLSCRLFPGTSTEAVRRTLEDIISDPAVQITMPLSTGPAASAPPLTPGVLRPIQRLSAQLWPGVPVVPMLQPAATDGRYLNAAGIATYGVVPIFVRSDFANMHGSNEHVSVKSLLEGRDFLYRLVKIYATQY